MSLLSRLAVQAARAYGILSSKSTNISASYLVVAGGGGGGSSRAAGGGGGGMRTSTATLSTLVTYTVTVGAGGLGGLTGNGQGGATGSNSVLSGTGFTTITSAGGGGGADDLTTSPSAGGGKSGGTGGGGVGGATTSGTGLGGTGNTPSTSPSQGANGGTGFDGTNYGAGGGGGGGASGATGGNGTATTGGAGGAGTASSISGSSVTYAGGGGGGTYNGGTAGVGGSGGGGAGSNVYASAGVAGTVNLGGGGGGGAYVAPSGASAGGNGGSGVVIISYTSATPKFVGGTLTTSGGNQIHTFTSSGTLSPLTPVTASYLVVAGGGAGGGVASTNYYGGGGGGAGGLLSGSTTLYSGATYVVTVGAGAAGSATNTRASNGSDSSLSGTGITTVTSTGGGSGGTQSTNTGASGGSGGGGQNASSGGSGTSGQGYAGGTAVSGGAGGGGGSSAVGSNGTSSNSGAGGNGTASSITGSSVTYAGGGGGGGYKGSPAINGGAGGLGGGGTGAPSTGGAGGSGTPNSGSGGGGACWFSADVAGGNGGSGTVIISYAGSQVFNGGLVTSSGGNTIHTFTATGALTPLTNNLNNSLRFRASANAYLSRTMNASSTTFTVSCWVKRGALGTYQYIFSSGPNTAGNDKGLAYNDTTNTIYIYNGSSAVASTAVYRDPSAWYHVVMSVSSGTAKVYINGNDIGLTHTSMSLGTYGKIGRYNDTNLNQFDGYLADYNFIDGQALEPYYFGNNDAYGNWKPIKYTGMYGTNGFYLTFGNTTSTTTLGYDSSPNGNNWTTNNISLTAGTTYDAMLDVPTNTSATVANYCVINPIASAVADTYSQANLKWTKVNNSTNSSAVGSIAISSGKWYWEGTVATAGGSNLTIGIGNTDTNFVSLDSNLGMTGSTTSYAYNGGTGPYKQNNNTQTSYGATYTANDVIGVAFDADAGTITFYKNNVSQGTAYTGITGTYYPACGGRFTNDSWYMNFGQRPFTYTAPTGYVALNTYNLPTPTILQGNKYMDATLYTGNGSTQVVVNQGQFKPDLIWTKTRSISSGTSVVDSVRGLTLLLGTATTSAEVTQSAGVGFTAFNSNGFSLGTDATIGSTNFNGATYVGWQWQAGQGSTSSNTSGSITSTVSANTTAGFSIVKFNSTSASGTSTIGHGLGATPAMLIMKDRTSAYGWDVWTQGLGAITNSLILSSTAAVSTTRQPFGSTSPTSSVFTFNNAFYAASNDNIVVYAWAEIAGFSKFGSYTGNGSTDGPFVYLGFRPKYVVIKRTDGAGAWYVLDSVRNTYNVMNLYNEIQDPAAEGTFTFWDFLSNGFKLRQSASAINGSGQSFIYMAFAENPFKNANAR
jgi:hypothetical protein